MGRLPRRGLLAMTVSVIVALCGGPARAQESLATILDREYVAHWLVCGPFAPDVDGGLLAAVAAGRAPLGSEDFMAARGGATKVRPQHLDIIETEQGDAVWQRAGATNYTLDLSPFYPSAREGVTYAGFYARSDAARTAYIDLQTPLGARIWLNGYLLRDVRAAPLEAAGRDQFLAPFRAGDNFLMIETPGAAFEELAAALDMTERELSARGLVSRPLLQGRSGFEIALRIRPTQPMGEVAVIPRLAPEGTFSGAASYPRQDYALTVFNNAPAPTLPLSATIRYPSGDLPLFTSIGAVPGRAAQDTRISVPLGKVPEGQGLALEITVTDGTLATTFNQTITREAMAEPGKFFVLTGPHYLALSPPWPPEAAWVEGFTRQVLQAGNESAYGIVAGPEAVWEAGLLARPEATGALRGYIASGQCATEAASARVNPLWLGPGLLYRNLALGKRDARDVLGDAAPVSIAWDLGALPAQYPQLLSLLNLPGLITDVPARGVPELSQWLGPDGTSAWLRRKEPARGPLGLAELRQMVNLQRREMTARGLSTDIMVDQAATAPPEPFLVGQAQELSRSVPSILIRGSGAQEFFNDLAVSPREVLDAVPRLGWPLDEAAPAPVREADALWLAHWRAQSLLENAQRLASFAALYGDDYPATPLAQAERDLLYLSAYARPTQDEDAYTDALSETRQAAGLAAAALSRATAFLAGQTDTLSTAPLETQGVRAVVVFNSSPYIRTDLCTLDLTVPAQSAFRLVDEEGTEIPMHLGEPRVLDARSRSITATFVARDVPGIGHRTYYLARGVMPQKSQQRPDLFIENDYFEVSVDHATGNIERITDKETNESILSGPGNDIALLPERPSRRRNERGLWTDGAPKKPSGSPEFRTTVLPGIQEISVKQSLSGGAIERIVRLYTGLKRIEFETRLTGGTPDGLLTTGFWMSGEHHATVSGAPFGAVVRAESDQELEYRTGDAANLHPALYWTSRAPGEQIQIGTEGGLPFAPTVIVHGPAPALRDAANALAKALSKRGVPVKVLPATIQKPDFLWSDSLEFESHEDAWPRGARMQIVLGSPEQNAHCSEIVKGQSPETVRWLAERAPQGLVALVHDKRGEDAPSMPSLLLIGPTATQSAALATPIAREITARGTFTLPASSYIPGEVPSSPERGVALLFEGSANVSTDANGATILALTQGTSSGTLPRHATSWRYSLSPFEGTWTSADLSRLGAGFNLPFQAATTDLHGGRLPARTVYAMLDVPGALLSALRPANNGSGRDGLILQAFNPSPLHADGALRFGTLLRQAAVATVGELAGDALTFTGNEAKIALDGFAIRSYWILPATPGGRLEMPENDKPTPLNRSALPSKYWLHRTAPPYPGTPPLALALEGPLDESVASVRVRAASLDPDTPIEAIVMLSASEGLTLSPTQMYVNLEPGVAASREIALLWSGPARPGSGITATIQLGDVRYSDTLEYQPAPLTLETTRNGGQIRVKLTNPNALAAEGFVDCVVSPAYWPEFGPGTATRLTPARQPLSIPAYETVNIDFTLSDPAAAPPMRIKAAANGHVVYADVAAPAPTATGAAPFATPSPSPPPPRTAPPVVEREPGQ